ncbi:CoA transferase [Dactylosporangium sp. CA-233914]|uniref:CaiB/BaiF CoA-transferase family protein n=1 Tax=Dactylosporangium sp. CA-233914 TaxID=3239934 RepID=UPI003D91984A
MGALSGIRVLELGGRRSVQVAGQLLAQFGADVVTVEPAQGTAERRQGPWHGEPGVESSVSHWYYNAGKRSVTLDADRGPDVAELASLLVTGTVVLDGTDDGLCRPEIARRWSRDHPGTLYCRVTPFGDDGPWAEYRSSDLVSLALGGVQGLCGYDDIDVLEPIAPAGGQTGHVAGVAIATAVIGALCHLLQHGEGQSLDVAEHDALAVSTEMANTYWEYQHTNPRRATGRHARPYDSPPWNHRCRDGRYLCALPLYLEDGRFAAMVEWFQQFGMAEDLADPVYATWDERARHMDHVVAVIRRFCATQDSQYLFHEAQRRRLPWAVINGPADLLADPHLRERGYFAEIADDRRGVRWRHPANPVKLSATPCVAPSRAPLLGEHNGTVLPPTGVGSPARQRHGSRPLAGLRVLDFSWSVVGPTVTRNLAALGAEVIKVEWPGRADAMRTTMYAAGERNKGLNNGPFFANLNVGKLSLSLDARSERGMALIHRLIAASDLVVESFSAGVFARWGLDHERLRSINPAVIYVSASGFGHSGPYMDYGTWGPTAQAFNGMTAISGVPGQPPAGWGWSFMDVIAGGMATVATLAAIWHRDRTGEGQKVEIAQTEAGLALQGASLLATQLDPQLAVTARVGNQTVGPPAQRVATYRGEQGVPHNVYPTAGGGHYDYCVVTVIDDAQWRALCTVIDARDWLADPELATATGRAHRQDEIDRVLADWTRRRDKYEVMRLLQGAGVPAGAVQSAQDRMEHDPQLRHRGVFPVLEHPYLGQHRFEAPPFRLCATPAQLDPVWPSIGAHTEQVLRDVLGLDAEEIRALAEEGVTWPAGMPREVSVERSLW